MLFVAKLNGDPVSITAGGLVPITKPLIVTVSYQNVCQSQCLHYFSSRQQAYKAVTFCFHCTLCRLSCAPLRCSTHSALLNVPLPLLSSFRSSQLLLHCFLVKKLLLLLFIPGDRCGYHLFCAFVSVGMRSITGLFTTKSRAAGIIRLNRTWTTPKTEQTLKAHRQTCPQRSPWELRKGCPL